MALRFLHQWSVLVIFYDGVGRMGTAFELCCVILFSYDVQGVNTPPSPSAPPPPPPAPREPMECLITPPMGLWLAGQTVSRMQATLDAETFHHLSSCSFEV